ncbi:MAG TPA: hypothetical protein PKV98_04280 [Burkholderiaceae bacterium]|nr:hypothetical protein [Burkholderiaceae bacterium]
MTTIAANLESMATDSMGSDGFADIPVYKVRAVDGALYGGCGSLVGITKFFDWLERGKPKKHPKHSPEEGFTVLELNKHGLFLWENAYISFRCVRPFHAIGAGGQAAVTLMMHGDAPPEVAVDASCDVVPSACSRPVHVYHLADYKPKKKRKGKGR